MFKNLYPRYKNTFRYFFIFLFEIFGPYQIFKYMINRDFNLLKNLSNLSLLTLISAWFFISYLKERYSKININNNFKNYLIKLNDLFLVTIIVSIFLFSLKTIGIDLNLYSKNLPLIFLILIIMSMAQEIITINTLQYISPRKCKEVFILGSEMDLIAIKNILKNYNYYEEIIFKVIDSSFYQDVLPDQLIISKENQLNFNEYKLLKKFLLSGVQITSKYKWFEYELNCLPVELLDKENFLDSKLFLNNRGLEFKLKRLFDILVSLLLLFFSLPLILFFGSLIWLFDRGPVFYKQEREGLFRRKFFVYKLRSMVVNAETSGPQWAAKNDKRITLIGNIIRKTRIDELPQLISVLNGDMSLIGPRPERPEFNKILEKEIPFYNLRHLLKPGLSGWAQVNYPYSSSLEETQHKLSYDLYYLLNYSIFLDLMIFFKTMRIICNGKGT